ncbi:MAG: Na/Pi cotransporter family protein [Bacteroidetes bacterium]|nr:Na/Pi cotransporter family protein [Bacteroidota bacterium]
MTALEVVFMLLGGIGLFIFSLKMIEESVKNLSGRTFKLFLQKLTKNKILAVAGSALLAALLQGSSVLMVMVLALVGAGVLSLSGALAFILGANIGTTLDTWVVVLVGFKMNLEAVSYPAIILAALLQLFPGKEKLRHYSHLLFGFGLMFISVSFMKLAVAEQLNHFDPATLTGMASWKFVLAGLVITMLIQSSLATMTLALSALHSGAIDFSTAAAIVVGSEVGTTVKLFLGTLDGLASKKRLALGNFLVNVITAIMAFTFLPQLVLLVQDILGIVDPLTGLVAFQSIINLIAVIVFLPFLNVFSQFLDKRYRDDFSEVTTFIRKEDLTDPSSAIELFAKDADYFLHLSMVFNLELFNLKSVYRKFNPEWMEIDEKRGFYKKSHIEQYEFLKTLQGELQLFYTSLRSNNLSPEQTKRLEMIISVIRSSMHASKSAKDVSSNIHNLFSSSNDAKFAIYSQVRENIEGVYVNLEEMVSRNTRVTYDELKAIYEDILITYEQFLEAIYLQAKEGRLNSNDFTTILNFNREMFTSNKAILFAVKDLVLLPEDAARFTELPFYKT